MPKNFPARKNKLLLARPWLPLVVVLVGPTASGKTAWGVRLAKKFDGEIISADSRQVYRGMDVGTGKDLRMYGDIPVHLVDIANPRQQFTVAQWQKRAVRAITNMHRRGKLPIVVGGTGLYVRSLVEGYDLAAGSGQPLAVIRHKLAPLSLVQLLARLKRIDLPTWQSIDQQNRRRVQRALEIYYQTGQPKSVISGKTPPPYRFLQIGISVASKTLKRRIAKRLRQRLEDEDMVGEVERLYRQGVSWRRLESLGLEYGWIARFLQKKIDYTEMVIGLEHDIEQYAKRQLTWHRRDTDITWLATYREAERLVQTYHSQ